MSGVYIHFQFRSIGISSQWCLPFASLVCHFLQMQGEFSPGKNVYIIVYFCLGFAIFFYLGSIIK